MIDTLSLCPTCYKKIPARIVFENGEAWMVKECDVHGHFKALVEKDMQHVSNFYRYGTLGNNNNIIIHVHDGCNMKCSWCYYPMGAEKMKDMDFYDSLLYEPYKGYRLMLSGGEPTERPDYIEFVKQAYMRGWMPSTITNMLNLADDGFFEQTMNESFVAGNNYQFALSFQHPKNYSEEIYKQKVKALENIEKRGLKANCVVFSIQSLDELDFIRDFYDKTKHLYGMFRIRTLFNNWNNKGENQIFLSELHRAFLYYFHDYSVVQCSDIEQSNMYCLYMQTKERKHVSLSSAPTVDNLDYHLCSRPVYMLARDMRCYPVPICQIVNEGIDRGWKDGFQLKEA